MTEEALRYRGLGAVVSEVGRLSMIASRRLQLAAEQSGTIGLIARRWRRVSDAREFVQPTASVTRWPVSSLPSEPLPVPGVGHPRWWVELVRSRSGGTLEMAVDGCDGTGRMSAVHEMRQEWRLAQ